MVQSWNLRQKTRGLSSNLTVIMGYGDGVADSLQRDILDGCKTKVDKIGPDHYKVSPIFE